MKNQISFSTYSTSNAEAAGLVNIFSLMELAKYRYDVPCIDIWSGSLKSLDDDYIDLIKSNLEERGLTVANLCGDGAQIWSDSPERRREQYILGKRYIQIAKKLGIRTIRLDIGVMDETYSDQQFEYVAETYEEFANIAGEFGCRVGPENHTGLSRKPEELLRLMEEINNPGFGMLLHLGGWYKGDPFENDMYFLKYAMHIHADYEQCFFAGEHLRNIAASDYCGAISAELHHTNNQLNDLETMLMNLKRVLLPMDYDGQWKIAPPSAVEGNVIDRF